METDTAAKRPLPRSLRLEGGRAVRLSWEEARARRGGRTSLNKQLRPRGYDPDAISQGQKKKSASARGGGKKLFRYKGLEAFHKTFLHDILQHAFGRGKRDSYRR